MDGRVHTEMRLIDANALKRHYAWWGNEEKEMFDSIVDVQPTVDAVPVVHAEWQVYSAKDCLYTCSNCHCAPRDKTHYCPNCGAKMDGGADE